MTAPLGLTVPTSDEVHVWWIDLRATPQAADATLSPDERARAARFHRQGDRVRWTRARVALRHILAGYLDLSPHEVGFTPAASQEAWPRLPSPIAMGEGLGVRDYAAKPAFSNDPRLRFNLTHAADRAALAVAWEREVGIDLEPVDANLHLCPLLTTACSPAERATIEALPPDRRVEAFLVLWTVKEAYLKAIGAGLFREPSTLEVEFLAGGRAVVHEPCLAAETPPWELRRLDAGPGWVAALAIEGGASTVSELPWPSRSRNRLPIDSLRTPSTEPTNDG